MKYFPIGVVLSLTTGRLVSPSHMDGIYEALRFLTGEDVYTHQIPRVMKECEPWLKSQFPLLMKDAPEMAELLAGLDMGMAVAPEINDIRASIVANWVEGVRVKYEMPETVPVYELPRELHTSIDPGEEARAMFGDNKVITIGEDKDASTDNQD